jgi:two-component sensor histidine kinase
MEIDKNEEDKSLLVTWIETKGPIVTHPQRKGFGCTLLERGLPIELDGRVQLDFSEQGLRCVIALPKDAGII